MKTQSGATLIEVAITVLILSSTLLAMATLQTRSLQFNQGAYFRSQANILAYDIIDRIRINRGPDSGRITTYNIAYTATPTGTSLANLDLIAWRANVASSLPEGLGKVECVATTTVCKISIKWTEKQIFGAKATDDDETVSEFSYSTSI